MNDAIKKIVLEIAQNIPKNKPYKVTRSLSLENKNFVRLQEYCRNHGVPTGEVIDKLIRAFLESILEKEN